MIIKQGISKEKINDYIDWGFSKFKHAISQNDENKSGFKVIIKNLTNWDISLELVDENNNLFGLYLLGNNQLLNKDQGLIGVEGVLLAVDESIRGKGYGNQLKNHIPTLNYDYIWGRQLKILNNLEDWLKRRDLVHTTSDCYITLELFNNKK